MIIKDLPKITLYFVKSANGVRGARAAFDELESYLTSLKGRKFYGLSYGKPPEDEYFACIEVIEGENLPLPTMQVPAGAYAQEKVPNWNKNISEIGKTFSQLAKTNDVDISRPFIEHYASMRELRCLVPIK